MLAGLLTYLLARSVWYARCGMRGGDWNAQPTATRRAPTATSARMPHVADVSTVPPPPPRRSCVRILYIREILTINDTTTMRDRPQASVSKAWRAATSAT